ncbi:MAG: hypothetical protein ACRDQY_25750, partial [Pseudonocardiaceae bacterium]
MKPAEAGLAPPTVAGPCAKQRQLRAGVGVLAVDDDPHVGWLAGEAVTAVGPCRSQRGRVRRSR